MRKIEDVLRLHAQGFSTRRMSLATGVGKTTVIEYLRRSAAAGVSWPLPVGLDEAALERLLFPPPPSAKGRRIPEPDWAAVHRELKRSGVTLALLWDEYRGGRPDGYGYSAFCERYRRWAGRLSPVSHQRCACSATVSAMPRASACSSTIPARRCRSSTLPPARRARRRSSSP